MYYLTFGLSVLEAATFVMGLNNLRIQSQEHFFCSADTSENTTFKLLHSDTDENKITRKSCFAEGALPFLILLSAVRAFARR